jgi:hypothetical protein
MRAYFKHLEHNRALVRYPHRLDGTPIEFEVFAPRSGGYVRFDDGAQVCERLECRGPTLIWGGSAPLIDLIRREYRAMRRAEKKYLSL